MKARINVPIDFDIKFIQVDAHVRYWEDSEVNGIADLDPYKELESPKMPFAVKVEDEWRWQPTIDVDNGTVCGWPKGTTAQVHYKVCDEGIYTLSASDGTVLIKIESCVPDCLDPVGSGYGDYIIMDIDSEGKIDGFSFTQEDVDEITERGF